MSMTDEYLGKMRTTAERAIEVCKERGLEKQAEAGGRFTIDLLDEIARLKYIARSHEKMIRDLLHLLSEVGDGAKDPELQKISGIITNVAELYFTLHTID